jgi:hypothetical protein
MEETQMETNQESKSDVIYSYTRAQAIADGVLVDVTKTAKEAGFTYPVALTRAVCCDYVVVADGVDGQDEAGRLWDVLCMLRFAIKTAGPRQAVISCSLNVRNDNRPGIPRLVRLKAVCGPNDDGSPCITVMLPHED